ncbi:MAG: hypothetical protein NZL88_12125, partial [Gaiellaceae bacterium]|nr:hypothetical protein [Gaiellaceae bacterium]
TEDAIAKLHLRHLIGGRAPPGLRERFFRFSFPERPGALLQFLEGLGERWNITLFHYRNHGAADGRVLVGFELVPDEAAALEAALARLRRLRWLAPLLGLPPLARLLAGAVARRVRGPGPERRAASHAWLWGEVEDAEGRVERAMLKTPNGYELTSEAALAALARVLDPASAPAPGFHT